jgi:2-polyprenyl-3-methyl-5-hydroxy-6-metoxy-1,4-benzoquinol methylase
MDYNNKSDIYYSKSRPEMLEFLPETATTILDVGCGEGIFTKSLKEHSKNNLEIWGIELMEEQGLKAKNILDKVLIGKCEDLIVELPSNYFDVIYFNDVLEHLVDPSSVLNLMKAKLNDNGLIVSSIPNVRYHNTFMDLVLNKNWDYQSSGVLDKTHLRFFTKKSIVKMYESMDFEIIEHKGINRSKSIKPYLYNILFLFSAMDIFFPQYATVVRIKNTNNNGKRN